MSRDAVRELDAVCGIDGLTLMARAARGAANLATHMAPPGGRILVCCGTGNNGGDGWAMVPMLIDEGFEVVVVAPSPPRPGSDAETYALRAMNAGMAVTPRLEAGADLIVDGLLGTGLDRPVTGGLAGLIDGINTIGCPVLAIDIPSGLDADTGAPLGTAVKARCTATFVGLKRGFLNAASGTWTGEVHVVDLGMPSELVDRLADPPPPA